MVATDLLKETLQIIGESDEERLQSIIRSHLHTTYPLTAQLNIRVPMSKLSSTYALIPCKGSIKGGSRKVEIDCGVACGHWEKLRLSTEEQKTGFVNIEDHFSELLPTIGNVGLLTFQNGILNSVADFQDMGKSILENLSEEPLCIGLYNASSGLTGDVDRLTQALQGYVTEGICRTRLMMTTFITQLLQTNPQALWIHIAHSEGGMLAKMALQGLRSQHSIHARNRLLALAYGPVAPISSRVARDAINTYSKDDKAALRFAKQYLNDPAYDIRLVDSLVPKSEQCIVAGDHTFTKATYQKALRDNLGTFRSLYKIYDAKKH